MSQQILTILKAHTCGSQAVTERVPQVVDPDILKRPSLPGLVARDIARFARDHYSRPVDKWIVVFGTNRDAGAFHFESSFGEYAFSGSDL